MKRMIGLAAVAMFGQPAWIPVYPGCAGSPCEVTVAPSAVVEFLGTAFKAAVIDAPVSSDGIGTVIKAHKDGVSVVIKVRERDGGALIITQSAESASAVALPVTGETSRRTNSSRATFTPVAWPAFFRAIDPIPTMPKPKETSYNCFSTEAPRAISFMHEIDDLMAAYATLFERNGYAAEIEKKRSASMLGTMHYFDLHVWGRRESTTLTVYFHRPEAKSRFSVRLSVCGK